MWDLVWATLIILGLSVGCFRAGLGAGRRMPGAVVGCVAAVALGLTFWFALAVHGTLRMAEILPLPNAVVLGNWLPLGAGLLSGIVAGQGQSSPRRRGIFSLALIVLSWYTLITCFIAAPPPASDRWSQSRVCLQSSEVSCSACSTVMLLKEHNIRSDEAEMVRLCLTGRGGTPSLGTYRGLKLKTQGTGWDVHVVRGTVEDLRRAGGRPILLFIHLDRVHSGPVEEQPWYARLCGTGHSVVLYGFTDEGEAIIGDPATGRRSLWNRDKLEDRWSGQGLALERASG